MIGWETHKCQEDRGGGALEKADGSLEHNFVGYVDTMLEYYLHVDPSKLTDEEWAEKFKQLADIRKREGKWDDKYYQPRNPLRISLGMPRLFPESSLPKSILT